MKLQKILCTMIAFGTFATSVNAAVEVSRTGRDVDVTATVDANSTAIVLAVKNGHSAQENNYVVAMREAVADENGTVKFSFTMPTDKLWDNVTDVTGLYDLYIKQDGKEMLEGSFYYASEIKNAEFKDALNDCGSSAELLEALLESGTYDDVLRAEGICIDLYKLLPSESAKDEVIENVLTKLTTVSGKSGAEIAAVMLDEVVVSLVNSVESKETIKAALAETGLEFKGVGYDDEPGAKSDWLAAAMLENKPYEDADNLESAYEKVNILYELNSAKYSELTVLLAEYEDELGISSAPEYIKYKNDEAKTSINISLVNKLSSEKPNTVSKLLNAIKASMSSAPAGGAGGGGAGGGGAGGGGGGAGGGGGSSSGAGGSGYTGTSPSDGGNGGLAAGVMTPGTTSAATSKFSDIADAKWAETAINAMVEKGIVVGDGSGKFRPNDNVTREEFVKMVVLAAGIYDASATCNFSDVPENAWYSSYVASAVNHGLISGINENEFGSGRTLIRQDMAIICSKALSLLKPVQPSRDDVVFEDESEIGGYAKSAIHQLYTAGLINGVGNNAFEPLGTTTRAQTAQILYSIFLK